MTMAANDVSLDMDLEPAIEAFERLEQSVQPSAARGVSQLAVLAEAAMKKNAPEGAGYDEHLRDTIDTETSRNGLRASVYPTKRTDEGWLLVNAIVGNPTTPTYQESVPVWSGPDGDAAGPLARWAAAKLGDRNAAWPIAQSWKHGGGQKTFPNPFVRDAYRQWQGQVERTFGDAFFDAMGVE